MKLYHMTAPSFEGFVEFEFSDNGLLKRYDMGNASLSENQQLWILKKLPRELEEIKDILATSPVTFVEVKQEVTFDMFWNRYDDKINSSKKKAFAKWAKMAAGEQYRAWHYVPKYFNNVPHGTRKKFAETYLNSELWNN